MTARETATVKWEKWTLYVHCTETRNKRQNSKRRQRKDLTKTTRDNHTRKMTSTELTEIEAWRTKWKDDKTAKDTGTQFTYNNMGNIAKTCNETDLR